MAALTFCTSDFILHDGRQAYTVSSLGEIDKIRERLAGDEPFEVFVHGSPEYFDALRSSQKHAEQRLEDFRIRYGDAYDEFDALRSRLDAVKSEIAKDSHHIVPLDENFSKYGYSAYLRTYNDGKILKQSGNDQGDWYLNRWTGKVRKLYEKPIIRQYVHKGLLWRASETTLVAPFELFFDLLFAGTLSINGDHAADNPTGKELLRFSITFILGWEIWSELNMLIDWIQADDVLQRVLVLLVMIFLLGFTTNMLNAFEDAYQMLITFYLTARLLMASYFGHVAWRIPMVRGMMLSQVILTIITASIWIASIHIEMPQRLAAIWIAIFLELTGLVFLGFFVRLSSYSSIRFAKWLYQSFEFYPAINIEHKVERTNCFVTLVFGYSVVAIIYQSTASTFFGLNAFFGKATLGLTQAFMLNWIYFEVDGADLYQHAIRRNRLSALGWQTIHLPFIMGLILAAAALSKLVLATDCQNANIQNLTLTYQVKSNAEILPGLRWFYCVGLGISLFSMGIISICHIHKEPNGEENQRIRIPKKFRTINRLAICVILFCLPLANNLNSLLLITTTTGLVAWILVLELWGMSISSQGFFSTSKQPTYTAAVTATDLELEMPGEQIIVG